MRSRLSRGAVIIITAHIIVTVCIASKGSCAAASFIIITLFNPSMGTSNYSATSNDMKLVHWPLMGGLLHLVQREWDLATARPGPSSLYQM